MACVLFFCSSAYALDEIADEMAHQFPGLKVFGCTTAGEIGPAGYLDHSLSGASFPQETFAVAGRLVADLKRFEIPSARALVQSLLLEVEGETAHRGFANTFAIGLIDGLSIREELVSRAFQAAFDDICLVGGSAGDDLHFKRTHVYADGRFHRDAAVMILVATSRPVQVLKIQNFVPMAERLVVTEAEPDRRLVREINGLPAAEEYARVIDVDVEDLNPARFAASPIVIVLDGTNYVRAVQTANPDGSLTFYCAIDEGMVLRVSAMTDLVTDLSSSLEDIIAPMGHPDLLIGFDCILRKLSISGKALTRDVEAIFGQYNTIGFSCYGEQYQGIHVNHTLTGIAIGDAGSHG